MSRRFEVGPANIRDVSYIAGNLRPLDRDEVLCQLPEGISAQEIGLICTRPGTSWIAYLDGKPIMVFGFDATTIAGNALNAWAFGTCDSQHAIAGLTHWVQEELLPDWLKQGVTRIEARSLAQHISAHRWLKAIGAVEETTLQGLGRNGENFILFAWHSHRLKQTLRLLRRFTETMKHVHVKTQNSQAKTIADDAKAG